LGLAGGADGSAKAIGFNAMRRHGGIRRAPAAAATAGPPPG
jgi:hypothetical protein